MSRPYIFHVVVLCLAVMFTTTTARGGAVEIRDIVGSTHSQGGYTFSNWYSGGNNDYLNEGAAELATVGSRVIKVWFHPNAQAFYPFTRPGYNYINPSDTDNRLVALAQTSQYSTLFSNPNFTTYILEVLVNNVACGESNANCPVWQNGMTQAEKDQETRAMKNLAAYLLQTYGNTGKTFVLQNWEGDWLLRGVGGTHGVPTPADPYQAMLGMRDWINARQLGVTQARALHPNATAKVVHAAEANIVYEPSRGNPPAGYTMVNDVIPYTNCDLYSYSVWDLKPNYPQDPTIDAYSLTQALAYLQDKAPDSALFGNFNVYIGEFGAAENADPTNPADHTAYLRRFVEVALGGGARYIVYWQLYSNLGDNPTSPKPPVSAFGCMCLVRADGTKPGFYSYLQGIMGYSAHHYALKATATNYYVSPDEGGGYAIRANASVVSGWERITIVDRNGGALKGLDPVHILTWRGRYFHPYHDSAGYMDAASTSALASDQFTIVNATNTTSSANLGLDSSVAFRTTTGYYIYPMNGGGPGDLFFYANASAIGSWQVFKLSNWDKGGYQ